MSLGDRCAPATSSTRSRILLCPRARSRRASLGLSQQRALRACSLAQPPSERERAVRARRTKRGRASAEGARAREPLSREGRGDCARRYRQGQDLREHTEVEKTQSQAVQPTTRRGGWTGTEGGRSGSNGDAADEAALLKELEDVGALEDRQAAVESVVGEAVDGTRERRQCERGGRRGR